MLMAIRRDMAAPCDASSSQQPSHLQVATAVRPDVDTSSMTKHSQAATGELDTGIEAGASHQLRLSRLCQTCKAAENRFANFTIRGQGGFRDL